MSPKTNHLVYTVPCCGNDSSQVKTRIGKTLNNTNQRRDKRKPIGITQRIYSAKPHVGTSPRETDEDGRALQPRRKEKKQREEGRIEGEGAKRLTRTDLLQRTWFWQTPRHRAGTGPMPSSSKLPASGHTPANQPLLFRFPKEKENKRKSLFSHMRAMLHCGHAGEVAPSGRGPGMRRDLTLRSGFPVAAVPVVCGGVAPPHHGTCPGQ